MLAKVKGEMSCGHRDPPKFQLLRRILDKARNRHEVKERAGSLLEQMLLCEYASFFVRKVLAMKSCGVKLFGSTASPMTVAGGPWTHGSVGLSEG